MADRDYAGYLSEENIDVHSFESPVLRRLRTDDRRHVSFGPPHDYRLSEFDFERVRAEHMDPKSPIDSLSPLTIEIPSAGPQRLANSLPDFDGRSHAKSGSEIEISVDEPRYGEYRNIDSSPKLNFRKRQDDETSRKAENLSPIAGNRERADLYPSREPYRPPQYFESTGLHEPLLRTSSPRPRAENENYFRFSRENVAPSPRPRAENENYFRFSRENVAPSPRPRAENENYFRLSRENEARVLERAENENYFRLSRANEAPSTRIHTSSAARQPRRQVDTDMYDIGQDYNNQQSQVYEPTGRYQDRHSPLPRFDPLFNYNRNAPSQYAYSREPFQRDLSHHMPIYGPPRPATYVPQGYTGGLRATSITRREKEPEKFDGRSVDWKDFIVHFEQCASWNRWTEHEKAQQLSMSLRGTAQKLLGDLKPELVKSYDSLKSVLAQRFNPKERVTAYRCEFRSRIRKRGESLADFGYALRRLVRLAYPEGEYNTVLEQLVINQFINGLSNVEMEKHVQFAHPQTLEAAIACAVEFEAFTGAQMNPPRKPKDDNPLSLPVNNINRNKQNKEKTENSRKEMSACPQNEIKDLTEVISSCFGKMSDKLDNLTVGKTRNYPNQVTCYKCGKEGHFAKFCRKETECQNCDKFGHHYRNCAAPATHCVNCNRWGHLAKYCRTTNKVNDFNDQTGSNDKGND
ncbi:unnamed protein product [Mytilus edulis]|uniref:CCHC-type domain-containing protein n=1 Tax=Mytilus edulis TaxID=6550 RepID=A0A8S3UNU1_MYTED|nr:unnamed protein product [Mytilus edulis]